MIMNIESMNNRVFCSRVTTGRIVFSTLFLCASLAANANIANTGTQQECRQVGSDSSPVAPNKNSVWGNAGLDRSVDRKVYNKDIIAYKIKWFGKAGWSGWVVKGVNDLHDKTLGRPNASIARLTWVNFYDHEHQYIECDIMP